MFIDAHTHAYEGKDRAVVYDRTEFLDASIPDEEPTKWILRLDPSVDALLQAEQDAGMDRFVLLPVSGRAEHASELNRRVAELAEIHPAVIPFGSLVAHSPTLEEDLTQALALGVRGFKIHPLLQRLDILSPKAHRLWSLLEEAGLPVVLDSMSIEGMLRYKPHLGDFAGAFRDFETGPERILFGTDAPWRRPVDERCWFERLPLDDSDREAIAWKNFKTLLKQRPEGV